MFHVFFLFSFGCFFFCFVLLGFFVFFFCFFFVCFFFFFFFAFAADSIDVLMFHGFLYLQLIALMF